MARAARAAGLEYLGVTDHVSAAGDGRGLDEAAALTTPSGSARPTDEQGITPLAGIECDIRLTARSIWPTTASRNSTS
jgi:hypothetical protein